MATQENPLLSLEPEKQQQLVDLVQSNDIEALATKTGLTRRQILGIGATLAGSGALGGYAATEAINPAQAQADTGDSDGNVGLPTDRVDVFADGIDSNSLSTEQLYSDTDILVVGPANGLIHRRDPSTSTTPVQDAIDAASAAGGGTVYLPDQTISEDGPINPASQVNVVGHGFQNTTIEIQQTGITGIDFNNGSSHFRMADFSLSLPGPGSDTGPAMDFRSQVSWAVFEGLRLTGVRGNVINHTTADRPFQIKFEGLDIRVCDAGNADALININTPGPAWEFAGPVVLSPDDSFSGTDSWGFKLDTIKGVSIGNVNIGGATSRAVDLNNCRGFFVDTVHYEPSVQNTTPGSVFAFRAQSHGVASGLSVTGATADHIIASYDGGAFISQPFTVNATVNTNVVYLDSTSRSSLYMGSRTDVNNQAAAGPPYFWCAEEMYPANPLSEGTVTVPAGGSTRKSGTHSIGQRPHVRVGYVPSSSAASDAVVSARRIYDASLDAADIQFKEHLGNNDIDIDYIVY